jgi:hypothetical protein
MDNVDDDGGLFLSKREIAILTKEKSRSGQIAFLRGYVIPYYVDSQGWPIVTRLASESFKQGD